MPACTVCFRDSEGVAHTVDVTAATLYEAVAYALAEFRRFELVPVQPGPLSELEISVRRPAEVHRIRVRLFEDWLASGAKSPNEQALKVRLRALLEQ